jgi:hypothetical protein
MMDIAQGVEYTALSEPPQTYRSFATTASQLQQRHNYNSVTTATASQLQQRHNYNSVTTTTASQTKICDFTRENFKGFEVL